MKRRRVAIIGGGFSGAMVAANLLSRRRAPEVVLIGQQHRFAPRLSYGPKHHAHLLNVRASNTEPLLRLNLEAKTTPLMEEKRDEVLGIIRG